MNHEAPQISWLDKIPFVGHLKSLIYYCGGERELAADAFKCATHYTGVACFGVVGGLVAGPFGLVGSFLGGIFGGLSTDASISFLSSNRYGYLDNMRRVDKRELLKWTMFDGCVGLATFASMILLTSTPVMDQTGELSIKCVSDTCVKPDFTKGGVQLENRVIVEGTKIPVENISEITPGDHVVFERGSGKSNVYDHHAIVGKVDPEIGEYTVYEHSSNVLGSQAGKASIKENRKNFHKTSLHIVEHGYTGISKIAAKEMAHYICHHDRDGCFNKEYNLIWNNCEHFAYFCATGVIKSHQIHRIYHFWEVIMGFYICIGIFSMFYAAFEYLKESFWNRRYSMLT